MSISALALSWVHRVCACRTRACSGASGSGTRSLKDLPLPSPRSSSCMGEVRGLRGGIFSADAYSRACLSSVWSCESSSETCDCFASSERGCA